MNIIKRIIQNVFRYRLTACFFIIGQLIMYVTIFGALGIYNKAYQKEADRLAALYKNRIEMSVVSLNKSDILSACTDGVTEGNIRAKKVGLYYTERKSSTVAPEIILAVNEELPYVMESGRIPGTSEEDYGKRLVALGRSQYRYAYEENGKHYVTFENETYEVTGIIGNEGSDYSDNMIVFDNRCLGDNVRKAVNEMKEYTIMIDSNTTELNDTYEKVYNNAALDIPIAPSDTVRNYIDFLERNRKEWGGMSKNVFIDNADQATITEFAKYKREHIDCQYIFNNAYKKVTIIDIINLQLGWMSFNDEKGKEPSYYVVDTCTNYTGQLQVYSWLED